MECVASNIQVLLQAAEFLERRERGKNPGGDSWATLLALALASNLNDSLL